MQLLSHFFFSALHTRPSYSLRPCDCCPSFFARPHRAWLLLCAMKLAGRRRAYRGGFLRQRLTIASALMQVPKLKETDCHLRSRIPAVIE